MKLFTVLTIFAEAVFAVDLTYKSLPISTSPGGRCMDGTMAGYYIRQGDPNIFIININGGGACNTPDKCAERVKSKKGSSKYFSSTIKGINFLDSDCTTNPGFCDATHVHIPYCTSDGHRGSAEPSNGGFWYNQYYFDGHSNFKAIINLLILDDGLKDSSDTKVLLTGNSAGGVGVYVNIDGLKARIPKAIVMGAPQAGWLPVGSLDSDLTSIYEPSNFTMFMDGKKGNPSYDAIQAGEEPLDIFEMKGNLPADCVDDYGEKWWACAIMNQAYRYIKTPLFHIITMFDSLLIFGETNSGAPEDVVTSSDIDAVKDYIKMYGEATYGALKLVMDNVTNVEKSYADGIFSASCLEHGTPRTEITIGGGFTWPEILGDWFFERGELTDYHRQVELCDTKDGSTLPCNANSACQYKSSALVNICKEALESNNCLKKKNEKKCMKCVKNNSKDILRSGCRPKRKAQQVIEDTCKANYEVDLSPTLSPVILESDDPDALYLRKIKNGKKKFQTCGNLMKRKKKAKRKICCNNMHGDEGAAVVCPITCDICT